MYNEDVNEDEYSEGTEGQGNGESVMSYEEEEEEYQKIRRDQVYAVLDYNKRKSKIICTLG